MFYCYIILVIIIPTDFHISEGLKPPISNCSSFALLKQWFVWASPNDPWWRTSKDNVVSDFVYPLYNANVDVSCLSDKTYITLYMSICSTGLFLPKMWILRTPLQQTAYLAWQWKCKLHLVGGLEHVLFFSIYWECHHPNWLTHIFQRGRYTTNQLWFLYPNDINYC